MTIVEDLQALDLTAIVNARASITVTAEGPELQGVLSGGVGPSLLGDLGSALDDLRGVADHPEELLDEVIAALPGLDAIPALGDLDLAGWEAAVREGAEVVGDLVAALGGDLSKIGDLILDAGGEETGTALSTMADYVNVGVDEVARLRRLIDTVSAGVPPDPAAFARLALDVLFPGPGSEVVRVRAAVSGLLQGTGAIALPQGRIAGLLDAHAAVTAAAEGGDVDALRRALAALERVRDDTRAALESDLRFVVERLHGLQAPAALGVITAASGGLQEARSGLLEFLEAMRGELRAARAGIDGLDPTVAHTAITGFLDGVEARAQELLVDPVEERVDAAEAFVRELFAHLPLRALRAELTELVAGAVAAIEDADLDAPAEALRARLDGLERQVAELDLGTIVRQALDRIEEVIGTALEGISTALGAIGDAVGTLASTAADVVEQAVELLRALADAVNQAKQAIDELPIEEARDEVVGAIRDLRGKAEELLAEVSLPEGVRPLVEQLTAELGELDVEGALLGPIDEALADFHVLQDIGLIDTVREVQERLSNLVPAQIADELQAQLDAVLDGIRAFRPDRLRATLEGFLGEAADALEAVDLDPVREVVHQPFDLLLRGFDELKPSNLLRPVLDAYDDLVGAAALPDPVAASQSLVTAAADAAAHVTPSLTDAARGVAPAAETVAAQVPAQLPPGSPRAGDVVRLFGWLPAKLREALRTATADARAAALGAVDDLVGGLAGDLRALQAQMWGVGDRLEQDLDALLRLLAPAQLRAQLALQARFSAQASTDGAGGSASAAVALDLDLDLGASLALVADAGPGALRDALGDATALATGTVGQLAADVAAAGPAIDAAAAALERSPVGQLARDVDAFLAALDPEPLAAELDGLVDAAIARIPALITELGDEIEAVIDRAQRMLLDLNPATLLQRFLRVLDVVRDELDVLNPHTLARELDTIHDAARATLEAYDPAQLVDEVGDLLRALATAVRGIDLDGMPGEAELATLGEAVARVEDAVPTAALAEAGAALTDAGEALRAIDLLGLVQEVEELPGRVQEAMHAAVAAVKDELLALLGALHYQQTSGSVSVSASASASGGAG